MIYLFALYTDIARCYAKINRATNDYFVLPIFISVFLNSSIAIPNAFSALCIQIGRIWADVFQLPSAFLYILKVIRLPLLIRNIDAITNICTIGQLPEVKLTVTVFSLDNLRKISTHKTN